jgi:gluconokinase
VTPVTIKRSTLRGTALIAAERLAPDTPSVPPATGETYRPARARADYYVDRGQRFQALYDAVLT